MAITIDAQCSRILNVVAFLMLLVCMICAPVDAIMIPAGKVPDAGSVWIYNSNYGETRVEVLKVNAGADNTYSYRWRLQVAGLTYEEELVLTNKAVKASSCFVKAFGLYSDSFVYPENALVFTLPLRQGQTWQWQGKVKHAKKTRQGQVNGKVLEETMVSVPAGTYSAYRITLLRSDDFGTNHDITLWFNLEIGVIKAQGHLRWQGTVGAFQQLVGLTYFEVSLKEYRPNGDDGK